MEKKRVGVLRGGGGKYYESSLRKGGDIISHIFENLGDRYKVVDILVDKGGVWHLNGVPIVPADLVRKVDVVWNTVHPNISSILQNFSIPHISNSIFSSTLENSREMLQKHMKTIGVYTPRCIISPKGAREVFEKFSSPWIVKINNEVKIVKTFNELAEVINGKDNIIVEEFISGKVTTVHSLPKFRGEEIYTFPLSNSFGSLTLSEKDKLISLVKDLHHHVDAKHYLKSDFVLNSKGKVYLLNIESIPDLNKDSHFYQVCESVGANMNHIVLHILEEALSKNI